MPGITSFNAQSTSDEVAEALASQITGKNVIISGATMGSLGAEAARSIAMYANLVVLGGRNLSKLEDTIKWIKERTPSANLRTLMFDLSNLEGARKAAAELLAYGEPIHVLINSAAVMAVPYSTTVDGLESHMAINHFAPFLFTGLLFPLIARSGDSSFPSRIVNVSALGHRRCPIRFGDLNFHDGQDYNPWDAYGQSKTANILFSNELARRSHEKGLDVVAYSLHPGGILGTNLFLHLTNADFMYIGATNEKGEVIAPTKTPQQGAATYIVAAFDPDVIPYTGAYLEDGDITDSQHPHAKSLKDGQDLWALSESITRMAFDI
ncbi:NAD(P)-binding protein [Clavulina sp. PMI_390]|nr:NAD(P)-binding protein [Clavulina sp. PMI_390]